MPFPSPHRNSPALFGTPRQTTLLKERSSIRLIAAALVLASIASVRGQEIPRPSMSRAVEADPTFERPYNLKLGPIALTANAGFGIEYVDNVNLSGVEKTGDLILSPTIGISGTWQITKLNNLELRTSFGYTKYLDHPELDTQSVLISPDSLVRLNIYIGDFKLVLHEAFSIQEDPINEGSVGGVAKLGRFTNTAGATLLWDLNDVIWSLGLDHYNFITTGATANSNGSLNANLSSLDHSTDQFSTSVVLKLTPTTNLGLEGTASYSSYPKNSRSDGAQYTLGPYIDLQLTRYTHLTLGGGYNLYTSDGSGQPGTPPEFLGSGSGIAGLSGLNSRPQGSEGQNRGGDGSGYYFNLSITHRLNRFYQDRLSLGRDFQIGLLSDRTESTFINYTSQWTFSRRFTLSSAIFYEDVTQTSQFANSFVGSSLPDFQRVGVTLGTSFQLTKKLNVGVTYQFTKRMTDSSAQDYTQNRVSLQFGYQF